jgi:hypothetical protein
MVSASKSASPAGGRNPPDETPGPGRDPFIPIDEDDDDEPTRSREAGFPTPPRPIARPPSGPTSTLPGERRRPATIPPPPPPAAFAPPPPAQPAESPFEAYTPPPPFADDFAAATPPPPVTNNHFAGTAALPGPPSGRPPLGRAAYPNAPAYGPGATSWAPAPPPNLRAPETIDFGTGSQPVVIKRFGPPKFVVLAVLIAAAAGGARLAHVVTREDMAALERKLDQRLEQKLDATKAAAPPNRPILEPLPARDQPPQRK